MMLSRVGSTSWHCSSGPFSPKQRLMREHDGTLGGSTHVAGDSQLMCIVEELVGSEEEALFSSSVEVPQVLKIVRIKAKVFDVLY